MIWNFQTIFRKYFLNLLFTSHTVYDSLIIPKVWKHKTIKQQKGAKITQFNLFFADANIYQV